MSYGTRRMSHEPFISTERYNYVYTYVWNNIYYTLICTFDVIWYRNVHTHVYDLGSEQLSFGAEVIKYEVPGCKHQYHMILKLFFKQNLKNNYKGIVTNIIFIHTLETIL